MISISRVLGAVVALLFCTEGATGEPYTVADAVHQARPALGAAGSFPTGSPDGRWTAIVVRRGNLETGRTEFTLLLADNHKVLRSLKPDATPGLPLTSELLRFETMTSEQAIQQVKWLPDSRRLTFLGYEDQNGRNGQIYLLNVETRSLIQLTQHPYPIASYAMQSESQLLVFSARYPEDWEERRLRGRVLRAGSDVYDTLTSDPRTKMGLTYYVQDLNRPTEPAHQIVNDEDIKPRVYPDEVLIAPSGRWALLARPLEQLPAGWLRYDFVKERFPFLVANDNEGFVSDEDAFRSGALVGIRQYDLLDLERRIAHPLLDAPTSTSPATISFSPNGESAIIAETFLPLTPETPDGDRRLKGPAILEVQFRTKELRELPGPEQFRHAGDAQLRPPIVEWTSNESLVIRRTEPGRSALVAKYRRENGSWTIESVVEDSADGTTSSQSRLRFRFRNAVNAPPSIIATDSVTRRTTEVMNLNPGLLQKFDTGTMQVIEWTDSLGLRWQGGLLLPSNYRRGRRYPLLIQTYGFQPAVQPFDFSIATSHPGLLLARHGVLVLQLGCESGYELGAQEDVRARWIRYAQQPGSHPDRAIVLCYNAAIDELARRGMVDPAHVGLVGFSATGNHVHKAVTFSDRPFAAAVIVDSVQSTLWAYFISYGSSRPGLMSWDSPESRGPGAHTFVGAQFFGPGIEAWREQSPSFHANKIRTPLLYEQHSYGLCGCWETYMVLKRRNLPIELVHYPEGNHNLETPLEQYTSQHSIVDWFRFWLKGEVDPDPAKTDQYRRWYVLREQHKANLLELKRRERGQ